MIHRTFWCTTHQTAFSILTQVDTKRNVRVDNKDYLLIIALYSSFTGFGLYPIEPITAKSVATELLIPFTRRHLLVNLKTPLTVVKLYVEFDNRLRDVKSNANKSPNIRKNLSLCGVFKLRRYSG